MRSIQVEERILELGPQRARLTPEFRELTELLSLEDELLSVQDDLPLFVHSRGKLRQAPLTGKAFLRTDLLSNRAKLRILLEPFTAKGEGEESVARFFSRRFGREAYLRFLGPLYGGLYGSDPARMRVGLSLERALRELGIGRSLVLSALRRGVFGGRQAQACSFRGGLGALPRALSAAPWTRVELSTPVKRIDVLETGGYLLSTDGDQVRVRAVVLTAPAPAAAELLQHLAPETADHLAGVRYNPLAVVHLLAPGAQAEALRGYGYQVAFDEDLKTRGVTWNHALFAGDPGRRGVFTAYLGGMVEPGLVDEDDERLGKLAAREFQEVTGVSARPIHVHRTRVPAWDRTWEALGNLRLPDGIFLEAAYTARPGIPGRLKAARRMAERLAGSASEAVSLQH